MAISVEEMEQKVENLLDKKIISGFILNHKYYKSSFDLASRWGMIFIGISLTIAFLGMNASFVDPTNLHLGKESMDFKLFLLKHKDFLTSFAKHYFFDFLPLLMVFCCVTLRCFYVFDFKTKNYNNIWYFMGNEVYNKILYRCTDLARLYTEEKIVKTRYGSRLVYVILGQDKEGKEQYIPYHSKNGVFYGEDYLYCDTLSEILEIPVNYHKQNDYLYKKANPKQFRGPGVHEIIVSKQTDIKDMQTIVFGVFSFIVYIVLKFYVLR